MKSEASILLSLFSGLVIFSMHPLKHLQSQNFHRTAEPLNQKGFVSALVQLAAPSGDASDRISQNSPRSVLLVCTHLDSRSDSSRRNQVEQLSNFLRSKKAAFAQQVA